VLGIAGKFWTISGHLIDFEPEAFAELESPGCAKAIWAFSLASDPGGGTTLGTVTRVLAVDERARRKFLLYWSLVGPFSALVRSRVLASIKESAERLARPAPI
jgi:hypothetical protein